MWWGEVDGRNQQEISSLQPKRKFNYLKRESLVYSPLSHATEFGFVIQLFEAVYVA